MPRLAEIAAGGDQRIVLVTADDDVDFTEANLDLAIRWGTGPGEHEGEAVESDGMVTIERTGGGGDGAIAWPGCCAEGSEEHTSELQSLMRNSYAVFRLKKKTHKSKQR